MKNEELLAKIEASNNAATKEREKAFDKKIGAHYLSMMSEFEKTELRLQGKIDLIAKDVKYSRDHNERQNGTLAKHDKMLLDWEIERSQADANREIYRASCPANTVAVRFNKYWKIYTATIIIAFIGISLGSIAIYNHPEMWPNIWSFVLKIFTKS